MAISGDTVFEVRTTGSDNNGGGFVAGASGTDYSQQNAAQGSGTNLTVDATTNTDVLPDGYTVAAGDVGNIIQITAGTGFTTGFYEIKSIQGGTKWRLDRSPAAVGTSGGTWAMGGALATPGKASAAAVQGSTVYIQNGTYLTTTTSTNVSNGCVSAQAGTSWIGYSTNRNPFNTDTRPILRLSGTVNATLFQGGGAHTICNLELDGNSTSGGAGTAGSNQTAFNCVGKNFGNGAFKGPAYYCAATGCTSFGAFQHNAFCCVAYSNSMSGFVLVGAIMVYGCLSINNTGGSGTYGFTTSGTGTVINCIAYGNTGSGFFFSGGASSMILYNCLSVSNGGYGFKLGGYNRFLKNCAHYNNTLGGILDDVVGMTYDSGTVALTADPFTNAAGNDFSLNNTSGGGADLKNVGFPSALPYGSTANYIDIGAVRHQDPAAGGGAALARIFGGF